MRILVAGGTGTVGSEVVRLLLARGEHPRVLTRSADRARGVPEGAEGVLGDLAKPETLTSAFSGVDQVVLITAMSPTEAQEGAAAVTAAQRAGVQKMVLLGVHKVEDIPEAPHFAAKIAIHQAVEAAGLRWTLVLPNHFFQNDLMVRQPLTEYGVYPAPLGPVGLHRVDTRDIAEAIVNATLEDGHDGQRYPLVGLDRLTGEDTAAIWSRHLGRPVRYGGDDLEAWAAQASQAMPAWLVEDLVIMFAAFHARGLLASSADHAATAAILRREPRRFDDFARETAAAWRGGTARTAGA